MKVCYRTSDGVFCDSAESFAVYPGDAAFIAGPNVLGRFGGNPEDYVVKEVDLGVVPQPHLKKLESDVLVDDTDKIAAKETAVADAQQVTDRRAALVTKFKDKTATHDEFCEFLAEFAG